MRALGALYGVGADTAVMAPQVVFTAISLEGDPRALRRGPVKLKLFYEPEGATDDEHDAQYAEVYLNIDLRGRRLELAEKDEEYRAPLVRALVAPSEPGAPVGERAT